MFQAGKAKARINWQGVYIGRLVTLGISMSVTRLLGERNRDDEGLEGGDEASCEAGNTHQGS